MRDPVYYHLPHSVNNTDIIYVGSPYQGESASFTLASPALPSPGVPPYSPPPPPEASLYPHHLEGGRAEVPAGPRCLSGMGPLHHMAVSLEDLEGMPRVLPLQV